jgi:hypothetical protein
MFNSQQVIDTLIFLPGQEHPQYLKQVVEGLSGKEHELLLRDLTDYMLRAPDLAERFEDGVFSVFGRPRIVEAIKTSPPPAYERLH